MRFLIDNCLSRRMVTGLKSAGHDAVHVGDLGLAPSSDKVIFERASAEDRIIVSSDTDFGTLLALRSVAKPSLVLFRTQEKTARTRLPLLLEVLNSVEADLAEGAVVVIEDDRIRVRRLPI